MAGGAADRIVRGERIVHVTDRREEEAYRINPTFREMVDTSGVRASLSVALRKDETLLGMINDGAAGAKAAPAPAAAAAKPTAPPPAPAAAPAPAATKAPPSDAPLAPSVRKLAAESGMDVSAMPGTGKDGRLTKGDMLAAIERAAAQPMPVTQPAAAPPVHPVPQNCAMFVQT